MLKRVLALLGLSTAAACAGEFDEAVGGFDEVDQYVRALAAADRPAVLIVSSLSDSTLFVQFSAVDGIIEMDFPLVTEDQQRREPQIRSFFAERDLELVHNEPFLDWVSENEPLRVSSVTKEALVEIFGLSRSSGLRFQSTGVVVPPN